MMLPIHTTFEHWMASLVVDFPNDNIPIARGQDDWRTIGDALVQEVTFATNGAPGTKMFRDKESWMLAVYKAMSNFA